MRILMISDYESHGGAAVAASRLAAGLCRLGHDVHRIVHRERDESQPWTTHHLYGLAPLIWEKGMQFGLGNEARVRHRHRLACRRLDPVLRNLKPDLINVHNIHGATWSPSLLGVAAEHAPAVCTMHDMWWITGRCAYSLDCERFRTGCNHECPTARDYPALPPERIAGAWETRRKIVTNPGYRITAVTPSKWLADQARAGFWGDRETVVIPNGVNLDEFRHMPRAEARSALGLPARGMLALFVCVHLDSPFKGADLLSAALEDMEPQRVTLVTAGTQGPWGRGVRFALHPLGTLSGARKHRQAYCADALVILPSRADNLPNVLLEALACGTPCVGMPVGGVPEIIIPGRTGWLAQELSAGALRRAISAALNELSGGADLTASCREWAETNYAPSLQAERYAHLFDRLVREPAPCAAH